MFTTRKVNNTEHIGKVHLFIRCSSNNTTENKHEISPNNYDVLIGYFVLFKCDAFTADVIII